MGTKHGGYGFGEWRFFWWRPMSMHVHLRILRICFLRYHENSLPENSNSENSHQSNSPLVNSPLEYSHPSFVVFFFFHYCHRYHWYYLKDCFVNLCFKSAEVFTLVKICQNEVLSEERQLMKWVGKFQMRIFWVAILLGEFSRGEFDGWEFFGWEFPRGEFP